MAGVIAGGMTKTNTLGVVGSIPIPEVIRNINSFTLGAQIVNPKVKTKVVWVNEWFNPPKETEAAQSLINGGADVLLQNTDSSAVLQTAEKTRQVRLRLGQRHDAPTRPKAHLGLGGHQLGARTTSRPRSDALDGTWKGNEASWWGVKEGAIDIVSISDKVPAEIKAKVETVKAGLKDGSFAIWKGPIVGQRRQGSAGQGRGRRRQVPRRHQLLRQGRRRQGAGRASEAGRRRAAAVRRQAAFVRRRLDDRATLWHPVARRRARRRAAGVRLLGDDWCCGATRTARRTPRPTAARTAARGCRWAASATAQLECPYHGWRFAGDGRCVADPGAAGLHAAGRRIAPGDAAARIEAHGLLWLQPEAERGLLPRLRRPRPTRSLRKLNCRPVRRGHQRAAHRRELPRPGALRLRARRLARRPRATPRWPATASSRRPTGFVATGCRAWQPQSNRLSDRRQRGSTTATR